MPGQREHKVCVVIPTWKRGDLLRKCLESLRRQTFTDFEILIVSNGAGSWAEQLGQEWEARMVRFAENRGFAAAVNAGIAASRSQYVAVLNDDAELDPRWLEKAVGVLEEHEDISFCCGKILLCHPDAIVSSDRQSEEDEKQIPPPRPQRGSPEARGRKDNKVGGSVIDEAGDALSMGGGAWRLGHGRADGPEFNQARPLFAVGMTAALFRRAVFEQVGGLDEAFISYLEDVDFSIRLWRAGLRGVSAPQAVAWHHGGASLDGEDSRVRFRLMTSNQLVLLAKHYPFALWLRLSPRIVWAQLLWAAMAIRKGLLGAYLAGLWQYIRALPRIFSSREPWSRSERRRYVEWLRESERAIYEDIAPRPRPEQDTYWRMYFALFRPRRCVSSAASIVSEPAGAEEKQKAGPSSARSSG